MEKLISQYREKINGFDLVIDMVNSDLAKLRRGKKLNNPLITEDVLLDQRSVANIQRQIYVQVIKDLEDYA
jgi:hypothetical protein